MFREMYSISSLVKITPNVGLGIAINKFGLATEVVHSEGVMFSTSRGGAWSMPGAIVGIHGL